MRIGLVGAAGRGGSFRSALEAGGAQIEAVCDVRQDALVQMARDYPGVAGFDDYGAMLEHGGVDAVVIGTPMQFHAPQAIAALQRGIHVLSEVPAAVSLEECRALVAAASASQATYMMAENYTYIRSNVLVKELVRQGLFGVPYYAEAEYLHELKWLDEITTWRRHWQAGIAGVTYCTHSLGPILQWLPGDRVVKVCCDDTTVRLRDPRDDEYGQMTPVMLCKTRNGVLIKIRVDILSDRPHCCTVYQLQGTTGCYESARGGPGERDKLWLDKLAAPLPSPGERHWLDVETLLDCDDYARRFLPPEWYQPDTGALQGGHGGGDYLEICDWLSAIRGEAPCPIGIHESMDMTIPGLISQQSVLQDAAWLPVPDSREW